MDWTVFSTTFFAIFVAEMGDKTQIAAFAAASESKSTSSVLLGTVLALCLVGSLGVLFGSLMGQYISPKFMKLISGALFILMGVWILAK